MSAAYRIGVVMAMTLLGGCASGSWDWFGTNEKKSASEKPVTKSRPVGDEPAVAKSAPPASADDTKAREVDAQVEQYVRSMNTHYDPTYVSSDFTTKIQRQSDPDRQNRIRQAAMRTRDDSAPYEPDWAPGAGRDKLSATDRQPPQSSISSPPSAGQAGPDDVEPERQEAGGDQRTPDADLPAKPEALNAARTPHSSDAADATNVSKLDTDSPAEIKDAGSTNEPVATSPLATNTPARSQLFEEGSPENDESTVQPSETPPSKPPVLTEMTIAPAPNTSANARPRQIEPSATDVDPPLESKNSQPVRPEPAPVAAADSLKATIARQVKLVAKDPNNLEEQFRLRLMYLIDGDDDKALAATEGINEDILEIMRGQIQALMAARSTSERDPAMWANRQLEAIETLRSLVRERADLRVPKVELCTAIDGFGRYEPMSPAEFRAGAKNNLVLLYIEVDNFQCEMTDSGLYRTLLSVRQSLLSKSGEELWSKRDENIEDLARKRRNDFYLTIGPLAIPKMLAPGDYVMKVEVEDVIAGKMNSNVAAFKMVP